MRILSAEKLKHLRLIHNLTQTNIADEMGISRNYISMVENRTSEYTKEWHDKYVNAVYIAYAKKKNKVEANVTETIEPVKKEVNKKKKK